MIQLLLWNKVTTVLPRISIASRYIFKKIYIYKNYIQWDNSPLKIGKIHLWLNIGCIFYHFLTFFILLWMPCAVYIIHYFVDILLQV